MKLKSLVLTLALFSLAAAAHAQTYFIRTSFRTNLRAGYSLSAEVVETAPVGAVLQVVGKFNRWYRIDRNGNLVWMADWVRHTRVDGAQTSDVDNCCYVDRQCSANHEWTAGYWAYQNNECPVSTQPQETTTAQPEVTTSTQTDNCCFVDRQCHSDQDWINGYWAHQNNQCGAPTQTQSQATAPVSVTQPGQVDNCCQVNRHCSSDQDWINGYFAYQNQQCLTPGQLGNRHDVIVIGGQGFIDQMEDALDVLKRNAPHWYDYTVSGLDRIVQRLESDIPGVYVEEKTFYLDYTDHYPAGLRSLAAHQQYRRHAGS